jgi:hypothetical protein
MQEPTRPTLAYRRVEGLTARGPRSVSNTVSGAVVGVFAGLMAGWFALMFIVGAGPPPGGRLVALVLVPSIAIGAAAGGFYFGRGRRLRLMALLKLKLEHRLHSTFIEQSRRGGRRARNDRENSWRYDLRRDASSRSTGCAVAVVSRLPCAGGAWA